MNSSLIHWIAKSVVMLGVAGAISAHADDAIDLGQSVPNAEAVQEGLFPEDKCKLLKEAGIACMGFKPAVRFSLPTTSFRTGSAELPDLLRKQLDVFADVLRNKKGSDQPIEIEGHADASGTDEVNLALSKRRADAVKDYLVERGADKEMLVSVGLGSHIPKNPDNPFAPENRRVEIARKPVQ